MNITDILIARSLAGGGVSTASINFWNQHGTAEIQVLGAFVGPYSSGQTTLFPAGNIIVPVCLGSEGSADIYIDPNQRPTNYSVEVAGDATSGGDGYYTVWGDASITIKSGK